jgi:hypothetical protein
MNLSSRVILALSIAPLLVAQGKYQNDVVALNPLGFWPLNGNPADVSGHGNDGTVQNGAIFTNVLTSPVQPQALVLNSAKKQFLQMPTAGSSIFNLGALHPLTAMAWVKTSRQASDFLPILAKFDTAAGTGWAIGLDNNGGGSNGPTGGQFALIFMASGKPTLVVEAPQVKNDGGWHILAATYDGSGSANGVKLYIDGLVAANAVVGADSVASGSILNSAPLTIGGATDGSLLFEGNICGAAVFGSALTPAQILQLADDAGTTKALLAQFAFGGGWYSAIYFTNTSLTDLSFPVSFTADNGTPLNVPSIGGSSKTITLAAGASTVIEAPNVGDLQQGYVSVTLPLGVTGYGVFRQSISGKPDQEAVVPLSPTNTSNIPMVYDDTKYITGVAIANPSGAPTTVNITVMDNTGTVIATSSGVMPPFTKIEGLLRSLPAPFASLSQIAGTQGTVRFSSTGGPVVVLGLRANGTALTSIPVLSQAEVFRFIGSL